MMIKKVLIVDDMLFMRTQLRRIVETMGFEVAGEAGDGEQAVQQFQLLRPDLVLMDITMPAMNGILALKSIRELDPAAVVIIISAMNQELMVKEAILAGAQNFIAKPFLEDKVCKVLESYL